VRRKLEIGLGAGFNPACFMGRLAESTALTVGRSRDKPKGISRTKKKRKAKDLKLEVSHRLARIPHLWSKI
jgi:hypothetical protein